PTRSSPMSAKAAPGTNRVTRFITGKRTAWIVALLPLLLGGFLISMGEAERPISAANALPDGFGVTEATILQEELTEGDASTAILLWTADEGAMSESQIAELREWTGE